MHCFLDIDEHDKSDGQTFAAPSRCQAPENMLLQPFSLEHLQNLAPADLSGLALAHLIASACSRE